MMKHILLCLLLVSLSLCAVQTGRHPKTKSNWQFLGKFVYQAGDIPNTLNYTIETENKNMRALLYFWDNPKRSEAGANFYSDYEAFMRGEIDCANFTSRAVIGGNRRVVSNVTGTFMPRSTVRPYWWFIAVSDCSVEEMNIESYKLVMTQTNGTHWQYQFSWDQWGIGPFTLVFLFVYIALLGVHVYGCYQLWRIEAYHSIIKLYTSSVVLQLFAMLFHYFHYSSFAVNGIGSPGFFALGNLISMASTLNMMFLCILIAKGWAITTSYITQKALLLGITGLLCVLYLVLFFWTEFALNPLYSLFLYETLPGISILIIRGLLVLWFLLSIRDTLRNETNPEKRKFYLPFGAFYSLWFVSLPFVVFICSFIDGTWRSKIVTVVVYFVDFLGFSVLAFLFWPSRARDYFTIRTTQLLEKNSNTSLVKDEAL